jgi:transposase-like protein
MKKRYLEWAVKLKIVEEAYSTENNIKWTAKKWGVEPAQIRRWKKQKNEMGDCGKHKAPTNS